MSTSTEKIHVLHIDDEPDLADTAAKFLEREDDRLTIQTATSADEGLERLENIEIDCIVSDYDMPGQDGITLLKSFRDSYPDIPFILFTGKGSEEVASEAISVGVTDYLKKESGTVQYKILANEIVTAVQKYRAEQQLDRIRRQYTKLVEQNFVGIYIIKNGKFDYVNPRLAEIHGYDSPDQIVGKSPLELVAPSERDRVRTNLERRMSGEVGEIQYQTTGLRQNGEEIDIELHGSRIEYEGESAVIGAELDITERKERERELERQNGRLAELVRVVSHDLRNPLNVMQGRVELAQETCDNEHLDDIQRGAERSLEIIDDMLTLARTGEHIDEMEPVELSSVFHNCWQLVETDTASSVDTAERTIHADRSRLSQLLENLIRNAVDHGGEAVTITLGELPDGFYIEDDGRGIPETKRDEVFESGYTRSAVGNGLGLTIVKQIAEAHGWEINVLEGPESGARFEITDVEFVDSKDS